jgi:diacylglycerol kinase (ATP)
MSDPFPYVLVNPEAGKGATRRFLPKLRKLLERRFPTGFALDVTAGRGQATELTRGALVNGSELIIAVGGDGTIHEVLNGFFDRGKLVNALSRLGILCSGTARDVVRNLNLPRTIESQLESINDGLRFVDVGYVSFCHAGGADAERLFLNDCQAGIAADVVRRVTPVLKRLGGTLAFGVGGILSAVNFRSASMSVELDGRERFEGKFLGVVVANGRFAGGGMDFAPRSVIDDGLLDLIIIRDKKVPVRLLSFPRIYAGTHLELPWILYKRAQHIRIEAAGSVELEADGELLGFLPCEIRVLPRGLAVAATGKAFAK